MHVPRSVCYIDGSAIHIRVNDATNVSLSSSVMLHALRAHFSVWRFNSVSSHDLIHVELRR